MRESHNVGDIVIELPIDTTAFNKAGRRAIALAEIIEAKKKLKRSEDMNKGFWNWVKGVFNPKDCCRILQDRVELEVNQATVELLREKESARLKAARLENEVVEMRNSKEVAESAAEYLREQCDRLSRLPSQGPMQSKELEDRFQRAETENKFLGVANKLLLKGNEKSELQVSKANRRIASLIKECKRLAKIPMNETSSSEETRTLKQQLKRAFKRHKLTIGLYVEKIEQFKDYNEKLEAEVERLIAFGKRSDRIIELQDQKIKRLEEDNADLIGKLAGVEDNTPSKQILSPHNPHKREDLYGLFQKGKQAFIDGVIDNPCVSPNQSFITHYVEAWGRGYSHQKNFSGIGNDSEGE